MRISIILPLYNKAAYVGRALSSILSQSFEDYELLVVDDGSTDEGASVVRSFRDRRITMLYQSNGGPGAARNLGLRYAQGDLVAFLDADDEWLPHYLSESVKLLDRSKEGARAVTSGYFEYPSGRSSKPLWSG